jgi:ATP-dependent Clp protease ATP-binding subunit ClpC
VDFKNTILIMTSNIGADKITHQATFGFERRDEQVSYERMKEMLKSEVQRYFRPEFLNRVDELVVFQKLNHEDMKRIVELEVRKVAQRLEQYGLKLELTDSTKEFLIERGTDEKFGARPLRRAIENQVEDPLSERILRGEFRGKDKIIVNVVEQDGQRKLDFEAIKSEDEPVAAGADTSEST